MRQKINAAYVHHQAPVPGFQIGFNHRAKRMKRSRVDDDVQAAKFFHGFRHRCLHSIRASDIALLHVQTQPAGLGFECQFLIRGRFDPASQNVGSARGKALGDRASDAGGPGDNRNFAVKFFHVRFSPLASSF